MTAAGPEKLLLLAVGMGTGGAESLIRDAIPLLREEGFEVTLWTLKELDAPAGRSLAAPGGEGASDPARPRTVAPARLHKALRAEGFDLIHSHLFWANLAARTAGRWAGVRAVINSHHGVDGWLSASHRLLERGTVRLADRVIVCSEAVRRFARDRVGLPDSRLVTIPNGIPLRRFAPSAARERLRRELKLGPSTLAIGSVGRLDEPVKGYSVLLSAMQQVAIRTPDAVCLVAGGGAAEGALKEAARSRGLADRLRFLGERDDIPEFLQALDLYVQPSLLEGFGLAALEAMASSLPVVASHTGGLPEVIAQGVTGELVPPNDPQAFAEGILRLLEDPGRRAAYGREGEKRARERFPLEKMVRAWADLYRSVLREKGRRAA